MIIFLLTGFHIIGCIISITLSVQKVFWLFFVFVFIFAIVTGKRIHLFNTLVETYNVDQYYEKNFILEFQ